MNNADFLGRGWAFPVAADTVSGQIRMSEYEDDVAEAIRIILHTRKGERVMRPDFGSELHKFVFGEMTPSVISQIESDVQNSIVMWESRVTDIEVLAVPYSELGRIDINVSYAVRTTNNQYNLVFPYFLNEG